MSVPRVLIAGGGVTGIEALLALGELAGDRVEVTMVAPDPDFLYKPLLVEEPFDLEPAERHDLAALVEERGASFRIGALASVRVGDHVAVLEDGAEIPYEMLIVCVGGRFKPVLPGAVTFPGPQPLRMDELINEAAGGGRIAFVVPGGHSWPLPIYELALMSERRARERDEEVEVVIVTPELAPLGVFGTVASEELGRLLSGRGIEVHTGSRVREVAGNELLISPGDRRLEVAVTVCLPGLEGPAIEGLPADDWGFLPIDDHARVVGADDVYAAGDGTNFPIKQGGLGTQQADAAAEEIAHRAGALVEPHPFHPVLRGKLLTGDESLHMRQDVTGGAGEGAASPDALWWPPHKIGGRFLSTWLSHSESAEPEPARTPLDVEVALPQEWHENPMALDPSHYRGID